jgi:formylglycine-generating enzyme required for sulfatase activity
LRTNYAVAGKTVGVFGNPTGGTAPFIYSLEVGDGINDLDNGKFTVSGDELKIQAGPLGPGLYHALVGITDSNGKVFAMAVTITVSPSALPVEREIRTVRGVNLAMRYVPSGVYSWKDMGGMDTIIEVPVSTGFWMAETETTQELYEAIMGKNPSQYNLNPDPGEVQRQRPVERVGLYEAILFCNRLSLAEGKEPVYMIWGIDDWSSFPDWAIPTVYSSTWANLHISETANGYRLPTLEEQTWATLGADIQNPGQPNTNGYLKYYAGGPAGSSEGYQFYLWNTPQTHAVGLKLPNELLLYDLSGNVQEWAVNPGDGSCYVNNAFNAYSSSIVSQTTFSPVEKGLNFKIGFRVVSNQ